MDLPDLTLHQLRLLAVVIEERSVSRAARRLGVSQPAVSHALRGLREALGDPLLVAGAGGLVATPRALALEARLGGALRELGTLLAQPAAFDPSTARRDFRLASWDAAVMSLIPSLTRDLSRDAPGVGLDVRPVPAGGAAPALTSGELDLAIEVRPLDAPGIKVRRLAEDQFVCVVRAGHPRVGDALDLETWLSLPHALISPQGEGVGIVDRELAKIGRSREVRLRIRYFLAAPLVVAGSDLVLTAPRSVAVVMARTAPLRLLPPPIPLPGFTLSLVWHERDDHDPGHRWLRQRVVEAYAPDPCGGGDGGGDGRVGPDHAGPGRG